MKNNKYDVVVVGAGPSGSLCARNLAKKNYNVLLVEKRPVVGLPVRCGEATGNREWLSRYMTINEDYMETNIHGVILHHPDRSIRYDQKDCGIMLDRGIFDQDIARQAEEAGAEVCTSARVTDVSAVQNNARTLTIVYQEQEWKIEASMVVAADGVESLCGQWAGLKSRQIASKICSAIELRLKGEDADPNHLSFWVRYPGIEKGYVWVFPKVKSGVLNVGCGTITPKMGAPNMKEVAMAFKEKHFPNNELEAIHAGSVPVSGNLEQSVADRFLLVGDAAHHTDPITGGGIAAGLNAAKRAANWIDKGFQSGELGETFLKNYHDECWDEFGKQHRKMIYIRDFIFGLNKEEDSRFFKILEKFCKGRFSLWTKIVHGPSALWLLFQKRVLLKKVLKEANKPNTYKR